jgi:hypothetical protein
VVTVARDYCNGNPDHVGRRARDSHEKTVHSLPQGLLMPSLFRFLTVLAVIGGVAYGVIFALANFVNPKPREITVTIPADKFLKR